MFNFIAVKVPATGETPKQRLQIQETQKPEVGTEGMERQKEQCSHGSCQLLSCIQDITFVSIQY